MTRRLLILKKEKWEYPVLVYTLYTAIRYHTAMANIFTVVCGLQNLLFDLVQVGSIGVIQECDVTYKLGISKHICWMCYCCIGVVSMYRKDWANFVGGQCYQQVTGCTCGQFARD